jgi:hypothetical protein
MKFSTMSHSSCLCPILFANNTFIAMVLIFDKMVSFIDILLDLNEMSQPILVHT